jgi:tetratricopeptide (TPR) repeat protein
MMSPTSWQSRSATPLPRPSVSSPTRGGRPDRLALARAVVSALRALASDAPFLLAIDDVQWLDPASARVLSFAVRRVDEEPIGILATLRGGADEPDPLALADALRPRAFAELTVGSLGLQSLQQLLRQRFDVRLPRAKVAALHAASGGNPMFALEFARSVEREEASLRARLPVPASLEELVRERVRALPEATRPLLELVAAIERPTLPLLEQALGESALRLVDEAVSAGAIALGADGVAGFTHPLLGAAVYFDMPPGRRSALHLDAAAVVDDLEQRARHLALATPSQDEEVAEVVERAAHAAAERGAPDAAAVFLSEAVRLTPGDDEPARLRRTFASAGYLMDAGDLSETRERIEPLLEPDVPPDARARALLLRAETEHLDRRLLVRCLKEAIEVAEDSRIRCWAWMRYAQHGGWLSGDARVAVESALEALRLAGLIGDRPLITASKSALAYFRGACGQRDTEFGDEDLVGLEPLPSTAIWVITPPIALGSLLLWAGELDRAHDVLSSEHENLLRQGKLLQLPFVLLIALVDVEWRAGRWADAQEYADEAQSILEDAVHGGMTNVYYCRVLLAGSRGHVTEARALAAEGLHFTELRTDHLNPLRIRWALGHVELAAGDPAAALQSLEGLPQALGEFGISEPAGSRFSRTSSSRWCRSAVSRRPRPSSSSSSSRPPRSNTAGRHLQLFGVAHCCCWRTSVQTRLPRPPIGPPPRSLSSAFRSTMRGRCSQREPPDVARDSVVRPPTHYGRRSRSSRSSALRSGLSGPGTSSGVRVPVHAAIAS